MKGEFDASTKGKRYIDAIGHYRKEGGIQMKKYIDIIDVRKSTMKESFIKCPNCQKEKVSLIGMNLRTLEEDIESGIKSMYDIDEARNNSNEDGTFYPCYDCGYIFPYYNSNLWYEKTVDCLICPKCGFKVSKTDENLSRIGYLCPTCQKILEYTGYPHHGTGNVKLQITTDYFHGQCPNCKDSETYGMMVLGEQIWVEDSGRVVLPLVCRRCGYRDAVKIATDNRKEPKILHHDNGKSSD